MSDRLNDTDPQSPAAMQTRTDPGLGSPPPVVVVGPKDPLPPDGTSPASPERGPHQDVGAPPADGSIDDLLDGITGPRPAPSSRRKAAPEGSRAYSAARPAPTPQPMPAHEPLVLSPEPPAVGERDALTVPRQVDAGSTRPVVRVREERTVISERRALARNVVAVIFSSALFAAAMVAALHWKEARAPQAAGAAAVVMAPLPPSPEVPATTASIVIVSPPPPEVAAAPAPAPITSTAASATVPLRSTFPKRIRTMPRVAAPAGSLDDLNREISH
jgi:hypothetical protein